jgi:SAM-dependent methyltransferase
MKQNQDKDLIYKQIISFYDEIADHYDNLMDQEIGNRITRQKVADKFCNLIHSGEILDFGGGTGLDLEWLTHKGYRIIFSEPSGKMREKAFELNKNTLHNPDLVILDSNKTDFTKWHRELPFLQKVDAILANFAAINCIPDIELLFRNLALVLKPGGQLLALILHEKFKKKIGFPGFTGRGCLCYSESHLIFRFGLGNMNIRSGSIRPVKLKDFLRPIFISSPLRILKNMAFL